MSTWRDIADQLTPEQIDELGNYEENWERQETLMDCARAMVCRNLTQDLYADVPPPPDATYVAEWLDESGDVTRYFRSSSRGGKLPCIIAGFQNADGSVRGRCILVGHKEVVECTAAEVRDMAADLLGLADELAALTA